MPNATEVWTPDMFQQHIARQKAAKKKPKPKWKNLPVAVGPLRVIENDQRDMITEIVFPYRIVGNNDKNGLMRMKLRERNRLKKLYLTTILNATRNRHVGPVRFELIRHSIGRNMDYDNLVSTGKLLTDQLVSAGVIPEDKPEVITQRDYQQTRALNKATQMTVIRIIDLPLPNPPA